MPHHSVTSDKCYHNREWWGSYRESDNLGGRDPYSMSKAAAELVAESWRRSYFDNHPCGSSVTSVRAGNVIGGGDYSLDRLVPDCVRAALADQHLVIRNPKATRPWKHVLDCLHGYLVVAARVPSIREAHTLCDARELESFNLGPVDPHDHPVAEVARSFFAAWPQETPGVQIVPAEKEMAEAGYLSVSIEKAQRLLQWQPIWNFSTAIAKTVQWYAARHLRQQDMLHFRGNSWLSSLSRVARPFRSLKTEELTMEVCPTPIAGLFMLRLVCATTCAATPCVPMTVRSLPSSVCRLNGCKKINP